MSDISQEAASQKRPVKQITLLMPVWGYQFIGRFLEFCLPTLLAPNNIPAIAQALPCRFVLLSSVADEAIIRSHPAWQKLERICTTEIQPIDDLITQGNHTATITLAFERAVRQAGAAMRDTCFIFLMSDYLVTDGSLKTVLATVQGGAGAVLAGNFQIISEDATPLLRQWINRASHEIVLRPRELVRWSLAHMHPATVANIVNFGLTHNAHTNRLFWRVDEDTLIGRFYLMHPIAIHPEVADFSVSASWDYSFVPELCPSGNVVALTDSDDYLVVELQRRDYEWENLQPGPIVPEKLAFSLAEWTTESHRRNIANTVVFHAADRPASLNAFIAQSDAFVDSVSRTLAAPPLRHRRHPYWVGSIAVNRHRGRRPLGPGDWSFLLNDRDRAPKSALQRLQSKLFGSPPGVTGLHPLWPDYRRPLQALNEVLAANGHVLLIARDCEPFAPWVVAAAGDVVTLNADHLLQSTRAQYGELIGAFDACLLFTGEGLIEQSDELVEYIGPLLKPGGRIVVSVINNLKAAEAIEFSRNFALQAARLLNQSVWIEDIQYVALSPRRLAIRNAMMQMVATTERMPFLAPAALAAAAANYFTNVTARTASTPPPGAWSSVCLTLRASGQAAPYPPRLTRDPALDRDDMALVRRSAAGAETAPTPVTPPTPEVQAGRLWQEDPAHLKSHLAYYRFVAAMMGPRHDVAEYGCASPLGTRLALRQFRKLTLFDPRPFIVGDLQWRFQDNWRFEARPHDILSEPLPRQVDSVYCIDFIQYVSRDEEDTFVRNLRDSLFHESQFVLIGSPSYGGSDAFGGPAHSYGEDAAPRQSRAPSSAALEPRPQPVAFAAGGPRALPTEPRTYWRTGAELKALMERFFQSVFIFSMIDNVMQPGIQANAQHIFALGCGKKT
jgi:SAM-dependent methyltransferase